MSTNPNLLDLFPAGPPSMCETCLSTKARALMANDKLCNDCRATEKMPTELVIPIEQRWNDVKAKRNRILNETIWALLPDSPLTRASQTQFNEYRKLLHRLTIDFATPDAVVWPPEPTPIYP